MLKNLIAKAGVKAAMNPIADDMKRVDAMIHTSLGSGIHRVAEVADYITSSGGKREPACHGRNRRGREPAL